MVSWSREAYVAQSRPGLAEVCATRAMGVGYLLALVEHPSQT